MKKLRVLQLGKYFPPYKGGFESSLYTLVDGLKGAVRFQVLVSHTEYKTSIERDKGLIVIRLASLGKIFSQPVTLGLFSWIRRLRADIIHLHLPNPLAMAAYLAARPKGKLIVSYHNDIVRQKIAVIFLRPLLFKVLRQAEAIVVTSKNLMDNSLDLRDFRAKCHVIPHGIEVSRFKETPRVLNESQKIRNKSGKPIILFVGRLVHYKGLKYLISAMKHIDAKLMIVGSGPLRRRLQAMAVFCGVEDKISWEGAVSDEALPAYYHACQLLVLPSLNVSESFGLVILEAQASGRPVVSTELPTGITFTNLNKVTGLTVEARNSKVLAGAVNSLLFSEELRARYGLNGRQRVEKYFAKELMTEKFFKLYTSVCRPKE